jgi:hypothetical protein
VRSESAVDAILFEYADATSTDVDVFASAGGVSESLKKNIHNKPPITNTENTIILFFIL